jgi:predicted AAA+ superfamily ATPase
MKYIRTVTDSVLKNLGKKPIIILYGARQVGKTTLTNMVMGNFKSPLYLQGDDPQDASLLEKKSGDELVALIQGHDLI